MSRRQQDGRQVDMFAMFAPDPVQQSDGPQLEVDDEAAQSCSECGKAFFDSRGMRATTRFYLPTGKDICWHCCERYRATKPQRDLTKDEATPEALALVATLPWIDDAHRTRALFKLRGGMDERPRKDEKGKVIKIDAARVEYWHRIARARPLAVLAEELWPLLLQLNSSDGQPLEADKEKSWQSVVHVKIDELLAEANGDPCGIKGGRRDYPGPYRLLVLMKWRARREGRLPMYGLEQRFRLEVRGMHCIVSTKYGMSVNIDRDRHQPGDRFISSTGYRSFTGARDATHGDGMSWPDYARALIETHIDKPKAKDGMGGKLERWKPTAVEYALKRRAQLEVFATGKESDNHWNRLADEGERLIAAGGFDPYELFPELDRPKVLL